MKLATSLILCLLLPLTALAETITVSAAVSLKEAVTEAARTFEADTGTHVDFSFGASGQLMAQIVNGANVDLFLSAADKQVDDLSKAGLVDDSTRRVIARNELVLIVPSDSKLKIAGFEELAAAGIKKLAMGEPRTVPAGMYAMQVLKALKLDAALADRIIYGASVRQVLEYVQTGDVDAGIVYLTDAKEAGDKVRVIATASDRLHEPIEYPGVLLKASSKAAISKKFLEFLASDDGQKVLVAHGFAPAAAPTTRPISVENK